jgi:hypothetical protein
MASVVAEGVLAPRRGPDAAVHAAGETRLGHDFSGVRVRTDGAAARPYLARQPAADDAPRQRAAPTLHPALPGVRKTLEGLERGAEGAATDPRCQPVVAQSPPWMPTVPRPSPIELGKGTRREPKLKEPEGPTGAKCRGACGGDCPGTCKTIGTYSEQYVVGGCGYVVEFPNAISCGTHAGCRAHDACFDAAVANGETAINGPRHVDCNVQALERWGPKTTSWARGGGPYDDWWIFVDAPVVRRSWRVEQPAAPRP